MRGIDSHTTKRIGEIHGQQGQAALIGKIVFGINQSGAFAFFKYSIGRAKLNTAPNGTAAAGIGKPEIREGVERTIGGLQHRSIAAIERIQKELRVGAPAARRQHVAPPEVEARRLTAGIPFINQYRRGGRPGVGPTIKVEHLGHITARAARGIRAFAADVNGSIVRRRGSDHINRIGPAHFRGTFMNDSSRIQLVEICAGGAIDHPIGISGAARRTAHNDQLVRKRIVRERPLVWRVSSAIRGHVREADIPRNRRPDSRHCVIVVAGQDADVGYLAGDRAVDIGGDHKIITGVAKLRVGDVVNAATDCSIYRRVGPLEPLNGRRLIDRHTHGAAAAFQNAQISWLRQHLRRRRDPSRHHVSGNAVISLNHKKIICSRRRIETENDLGDGVAVGDVINAADRQVLAA